MLEPSSSTPVAADPSRPEGLARVSLATGLASLTPLPFIDDIVIARLRKNWVTQWLKSSGLSHEEGAVDTLIDGEKRSLVGRAGKMGLGVATKPARKILRNALRKTFLWLAARRASVTALETYLIGRSLARARHSGVWETHLSLKASGRVASAFRTAARGIDRQLVMGAAKILWDSVPRRIQDRRIDLDEKSAAEDVPIDPDLYPAEAAQLRAATQTHEVRSLFAQFDRKFDDALAAPPSPEAPTPNNADAGPTAEP